MNRGLKIITSVVHLSLFTVFFTNTIFAETITVRANRDYFPATYMTDNGWEGMDIDIINEIFLRAKLDYQIIEQPFKRSLLDMQTGKTHFIPNLSKNEKRSAYMHWLGPIRITGIGLVVLKKNQHLPIKTCDDLIIVSQQKKNRFGHVKFGYVRGASYSDFFDNRMKNDSALKKALYLTKGVNQNIMMLKAGRIIGYFQDDFEAQKRILDQSQNRDQRYDGLVLHSYHIEDSIAGAYIGISKKLDKTLYKKCIMAFQSMKNDGTFAKIHSKWMGKKPAF